QTAYSWAIREGVCSITSIEELNRWLDIRPVKVLFSVVNPIIFPSSQLTRARHAFGYHEGPLSRYTGSRATAWALIAHENSFAITWHRANNTFNAGDSE
ncbi:hypothetical protein K7432_018518, partial [Basidiobolus ranarum]